jgi:hypothetical protein
MYLFTRPLQRRGDIYRVPLQACCRLVAYAGYEKLTVTFVELRELPNDTISTQP